MSFFIFLCSLSFADLCEEPLSVIVVLFLSVRHRETSVHPTEQSALSLQKIIILTFLFFRIQASGRCFQGTKVPEEASYCKSSSSSRLGHPVPGAWMTLFYTCHLVTASTLAVDGYHVFTLYWVNLWCCASTDEQKPLGSKQVLLQDE